MYIFSDALLFCSLFQFPLGKHIFQYVSGETLTHEPPGSEEQAYAMFFDDCELNGMPFSLNEGENFACVIFRE